MKFAVVLLSVLVAVQGRTTGVQPSRMTDAAPGENPWLVHLRTAYSSSGRLETCGGVLINTRWVLTDGLCARNLRFVWIRYGAISVMNPELVTESSIAVTSPDEILGLIDINRNVEFTDTIHAVTLSANATVPENAKFCAYGEILGTPFPGETLRCIQVSLKADEEGDFIKAYTENSDHGTSRHDIGAPLVHDGVLIGILMEMGRGGKLAGEFLRIDNYLDWISQTTGMVIPV